MRIFLLLIAALVLHAATLQPVQSKRLKGAVLDMVIDGGKIYIATDNGKVVVLDEKNLSLIQEIKVRKVKDFMGDLHPADIYSVDVMDGKILYLAQAEDGYAELYLNEKGKATKVLDKSAMLYAKAAKFVEEKTAILALMSDEVLLYDLAQQKILKRAKVGEYFYSTSAMDKSRKAFVVGDEGGEVIVVDPTSLKVKKLFKDVNKDKILSIFINGNLIAAGSRADKAFAIYDLKSGGHKIRKNPSFFIYVVGLSPDNKLAVYGDNEKYILKVVDTATLDVKHQLVGHKGIVNVVRFSSPKVIVTGSELGEIIKWRLP